MRTAGKALGWIVSIVTLTALVVLAVTEEALSNTVDLPQWVTWAILGGLGLAALAFFGAMVVSGTRRQQRQARRAAREQARARRSTDEYSELD